VFSKGEKPLIKPVGVLGHHEVYSETTVGVPEEHQAPTKPVLNRIFENIFDGGKLGGT